MSKENECIQMQVNCHTLVAANFPIKLWEEWKRQCKEQYGDIYWIKVWADHTKAQEYDKIVIK